MVVCDCASGLWMTVATSCMLLGLEVDWNNKNNPIYVLLLFIAWIHTFQYRMPALTLREILNGSIGVQ